MSLPYKVRYKLPLEYLTLQDWNNFVKNLLFINQYGSAKLLQYYQNGNFQNLNEVIAKYLYVSALKVMGYNVLHNLSQPLAYTFGEGNQQPFESMSNRPTVQFNYQIPFEFIQFYPISKLPNYQFLVFPIEKLQVKLSQVSKQLQLLIPKLISKIVTPSQIAGTQFQFSGSANVQQLVENYLDPSYLQTWREIIIQNLGNSAVQINNAIYLMPKQCLRITASSPSEIQLTAQTPTLLSEEIEFTGIPITTYTITITNTQSDPTPSPFQQLLILNLSSILSSPSQLLNLQFCLDVNCNTPLYAWIEQNNLSNAYIWIKIPTSIPANGSLTIYMFVRNSIQYPYTGIAPYLTSTYAQYDNGENVFIFYDNFAGTSLNTNKWNALTSYYSVNNGLTIENGTSDVDIVSVQSFNMPFIIDAYAIDVSLSSNGAIAFGYNGSNEYALFIYTYNLWEGTPANDGETNLQSNNYDKGGNEIITIEVTSSELEFEYNYQEVNTYSGTINGNGNIGFASSAGSSGNVNFYWIRVRAYPPNGVMPSNSQPQKTIVIVG
jgi:hypothetical protein